MPFPCRVNSYMPCRDPAILRQCRVLRESLRGRRKYPNCQSATGNNLRGTPCGSRKKPNAGRSPTCCLWTADANSHIPCRSHAALCHGPERSLSERHGHGMACVNQTRLHCVKQMGKTQSKPIVEWRGMCELALTVTLHGQWGTNVPCRDRHYNRNISGCQWLYRGLKTGR
jgi:hypothetical protein